MTAPRTLAATLAILVLAVGQSALASGPGIDNVVRIVNGPTPLDDFRYPEGVTIDAERGIFVIADTGNHRLVVFDTRWRSRGVVPLRAQAKKRVQPEPKAVAMDERGRLFVVDTYAEKVEVMTSRGDHLATLSPFAPEELEGPLRPQDIRIGSSGRIYVLYGGDLPGFAVFEPTGRVASTVGFVPVENGPFVGPLAIAVNADETRIAVVDAQADRAILVFNAGGTLADSFGEHGEGEGTVSMPVHVTWGPGESLWITDTLRHSISVFDNQGKYLGRVGGFGGGPGQFYYPVACEFLASDRLVVLERANARFQVLDLTLPSAFSADAGCGRWFTGVPGEPPHTM
jgi:DNA-binding beta-propeller fold protein YncE